MLQEKTQKTSFGNKRKPNISEHYTVEEYFEEDSDLSESSDEELEEDPEWAKTPLHKRLKKLRNGANRLDQTTTLQPKRRRTEEGENDQENSPPKSKRTSSNNSTLKNGCGCKSDCSTMRCKCKKNGPTCSVDECGCSPSKCKNRREPLGDANNTANLLNENLLNETFDVQGSGGFKLPPIPKFAINDDEENSPMAVTGSPMKKKSDKRFSYFTSPTEG